MSVIDLRSFFQWGAIAFAFLSAGLWFWSTIAVVPYDPEDHGAHIITGTDNRAVDHIPTVELQAKINRYAAAATGVASLFAAIQMFICQISN